MNKKLIGLWVGLAFWMSIFMEANIQDVLAQPDLEATPIRESPCLSVVYEDLEIGNVYMTPGPYRVGQRIIILMTLRNYGSDKYNVEYTVKTGEQILRYTIPFIRGNSTMGVYAYWEYERPGWKNVRIKIDSNNQYHECDETNNSWKTRIFVHPNFVALIE